MVTKKNFAISLMTFATAQFFIATANAQDIGFNGYPTEYPTAYRSGLSNFSADAAEDALRVPLSQRPIPEQIRILETEIFQLESRLLQPNFLHPNTVARLNLELSELQWKLAQLNTQCTQKLKTVNR